MLKQKIVHSEYNSTHVRFEVFMAVTMKKAVFWDVAPCRCGVNQSFGGTYPFHLQGIFASGFSYFSFYREDGGDMFLRNVG
jgi:hypothetical protein